jgi:hypothetical protein
MDSNYENNVSKDIISNSTKKKVSQMKDSQTAVNNFTIIIDFGDTSKLQSFVSDSENPIWLMYVVFNWDYKVTTNVVSYLEHDTDL